LPEANPPAAVHIVSCSGYDRSSLVPAVRECWAQAAPAGLIQPGMRVLLKPNVINDMPPQRAVCTHPEVVRAVAEIVLEAGAEVIVADQPGYALADEAELAFSGTGMIQACQDLPVEFRLLARGGYDEVRLEQHFQLEVVQFARDVLQADVVINLPKAKTHGQTLMTGAIKNMFGAVAPRQRLEVHLKSRYWALSEAIVDCFAARPPHLHLMDGVVAMEGMGPTQGSPRALGVLIASTDAVALDAVAAAVMGFGPEEIATTVASGNLGLGVRDLGAIEVTGRSIAEVAQRIKRAPIVRPDLLGPLVPLLGWIVRARPRVDRRKCRACGACAGICPARVITIEDYAVIDYSGCLECFCCQEACPFDAITVGRSRAFGIGWWLKRRLDRVLARRKQ
jgi:uncharacterized protein (DUF362 family)/Pyruvate/2-oxoacid:ferredoxin oxidoreductase delta subunit